MSFLTITDPMQREKIVKEHVKRIRSIQQEQKDQRLAEQFMFSENEKLFKPVINEIQKQTDHLREATMSKAANLPLQALPSIAEPGEDINIGPIARKYLSTALKKKQRDEVFGIYYANGEYKIGDSNVEFVGDNLKIQGIEYPGTEGLWSLLMEKRPKNYDADDMEYYHQIMNETNNLHQNNNGNSKRPKSSKGEKWNVLLSPVWKEKTKKIQKKGQGITVIPSDVNALASRLALLTSGYQAGNKTVRSEIVGILDELKRQEAITLDDYHSIHQNVFK